MTTTAPARNYLAEITTTAKARPSSIWLYGEPGVGKTSMAAAIPGVVFMTDPMEQGIHTLKANGLVDESVGVLPTAENWPQVMDMVSALINAEHPHTCLAIDTMEGICSLLVEYVTQTKYEGDEDKFGHYGKGAVVVLNMWRELLAELDVLRDSGVRVVLLGHDSVATLNDPMADPYNQHQPSMFKKCYEVTVRWADMVLFCRPEIQSVDKNKRARDGVRTIFCEGSAALVAKNRHGLPPTVPMGQSGQEAWANLTDAIKKGKR